MTFTTEIIVLLDLVYLYELQQLKKALGQPYVYVFSYFSTCVRRATDRFYSYYRQVALNLFLFSIKISHLTMISDIKKFNRKTNLSFQPCRMDLFSLFFAYQHAFISRPKNTQRCGKVKRLLFCLKYRIQRIQETVFQNFYDWFSKSGCQLPYRNAQIIPLSDEEIFRMFVDENQKNILSFLMTAQIRKYEK